MDAEQKAAVITDTSQGIGEALVKAYVQLNYRVVSTSSSIQPSISPDVLAAPGDIGNSETGKRVVADGLAHFGRIDTLTNYVGIFAPCPFTDQMVEQHVAVVATNLFDFFFMRRQEAWQSNAGLGIRVNAGAWHN
jgi:NAD(P)-dependent dehydrogenase (short-subunit alcohol dehydrogenase family)